ncbi:ScyD/ScyE family protein [Rhodocytophaga rosea]|uniref:ScyD/ScyE family protein n=1 Tax=Rhodocytophaga rosea TaxID=2704465 RepID=A0A6C0GSU3_9BACT|nr:ScyD/ScyE family protein [Rhodocytophaga rosea]QHT70623.1 ScyD/ScyE family protein [Rhodocytophaga rosea]
MRHKPSFLIFISVLFCMTSCDQILDLLEEHKPDDPKIELFASGLVAPLGIEVDTKGQLWVTEAGTGTANNGTLSFITPTGIVHPVVEGFPSTVSPEGAVFGLNHLLLKGDTLFMLHGTEGKLYKFNISEYAPGDAPLQASTLAYEDIGTFVKEYSFEEDTDETDIFNLTIGPEGDIFIVDAAANAVIRRDAITGQLSVFASIPPIDNPSGEPVQVQAVPTGIVFDGQKFLVGTFTGFPFPAGKATIYQVDVYGKTSVYQSGLSVLTDIELGLDHKPIVTEYGTFTEEGFAANSGKVIRSAKGQNKALLSGLNFPNSIERGGLKTYYLANTFDGEIQKITF